MFPQSSALRMGSGNEGRPERSTAPHRKLQRRRTTHELPPCDLSTPEIKRLVRRETLRSYLYELPDEEPWPAAFFCSEPRDLKEDHDTIIEGIEDIHQRQDPFNDSSKSLTRSSTWEEPPSRTSSYGNAEELTSKFVGLVIGPTDRSTPTCCTLAPDQPQFAGPSFDGSDQGLGVSQYAGSSFGDRYSFAEGSGEPIPQSLEPPTASIAEASTRTEREKPKNLACPMCKANPKRYERVEGPCTALKGITPTPKALMEHLKKHHSQKNRCTICSKWFKSDDELRTHTRGNATGSRCQSCCKEFKNAQDKDKHYPCESDEFIKPELFDEKQEEAFGGMKGKIGQHHGLEKKWKWVFCELFPHLKEKVDDYWPYYDFAVFPHKFSQPLPTKEIRRAAGGIRRDASPTSPSGYGDDGDGAASDEQDGQSLPNKKRKARGPPGARRPSTRRARTSMSTLGAPASTIATAPSLISDNVRSVMPETIVPETPPPSAQARSYAPFDGSVQTQVHLDPNAATFNPSLHAATALAVSGTPRELLDDEPILNADDISQTPFPSQAQSFDVDGYGDGYVDGYNQLLEGSAEDPDYWSSLQDPLSSQDFTKSVSTITTASMAPLATVVQEHFYHPAAGEGQPFSHAITYNPFMTLDTQTPQQHGMDMPPSRVTGQHLNSMNGQTTAPMNEQTHAPNQIPFDYSTYPYYHPSNAQ